MSLELDLNPLCGPGELHMFAKHTCDLSCCCMETLGKDKRTEQGMSLSLYKSMNMNLPDCVSSPPSKSFISKGMAELGEAAKMATGVQCVCTKSKGDRTVFGFEESLLNTVVAPWLTPCPLFSTDGQSP